MFFGKTAAVIGWWPGGMGSTKAFRNAANVGKPWIDAIHVVFGNDHVHFFQETFGVQGTDQTDEILHEGGHLEEEKATIDLRVDVLGQRHELGFASRGLAVHVSQSDTFAIDKSGVFGESPGASGDLIQNLEPPLAPRQKHFGFFLFGIVCHFFRGPGPRNSGETYQPAIGVELAMQVRVLVVKFGQFVVNGRFHQNLPVGAIIVHPFGPHRTTNVGLVEFVFLAKLQSFYRGINSVLNGLGSSLGRSVLVVAEPKP